MEKTFVYGMAVSGDNFTDRINETKRIRSNFEGGVNTILISPRRMGKTSLINKVCESIERKDIKTIRMDIYDCRSEYDFYNTFCSEIIRQTSSKVEQAIEYAREFLGRLVPKISVSPDSVADYSISLGLAPKDISPDEILSLPEKIATKRGIHIIVCIDEFQQIGEFPDSLSVQKRLRSVWQHFRNVSFCFYGSKKHMMENIFQNKRMPFYQFGDMVTLDKIPTEDWIDYIIARFEANGKSICREMAMKICTTVDNYSSYVQQFAWNVYVNTEKQVTDSIIETAFDELMAQCSGLFIQQINGLSAYQMNFLRAICHGIHSDFGSASILEDYRLGTKSNITTLKKALQDKELIELKRDGVHISDPVFEIFFRKQYC